MNHTVQAEGFGIRLRPVKMEDSAFIVWLRNLEHARGRVGDSAADAPARKPGSRNTFNVEAIIISFSKRSEEFPLALTAFTI